MELAGEAEKLAKRLHPRGEEAAERHALDAFLGTLDKNLAMEVQKLGHQTMEEVVTATRRIEKILEEQIDSKMECLVNSMQDQIRILNKDLKEANEQITTYKAAAPTAAAMAAIPAPASTVAATTQAATVDHDYGDEINFPRLPRRQIDRCPPRCFLCGEEGHVAANCPVRPVLQRLLRPQTVASAHDPTQGPIQELPTAKDDSHSRPQVQLNLLEGSPEAKVTPVACAVGPPITGQLNLEGIPVLGLVDTGASVTCMGFSVWCQYCTQWGPLKPFEEVVHGAHGKPFQIAGKTQHLNLQWGEAMGRVSFIVIISLGSDRNGYYAASTSPYRCHPQYRHACPAGSTNYTPQSRPDAKPPNVRHALLLQAVDIPAKTARLVRCHNQWPSEDVYFCPEEGLATFVSGVPALTSGYEVWVAVYNHCTEPLRLHTGQTVGTLEIVALADLPSPPPASSPHRQLPVPEHLSPTQQQQLKALFQEFSDIISQGEDDSGCTPLLHHTIETEGPPLCQPYRRQNPAVCREEMTQFQQMLSSGVICPSNSPWASPVIMVKKKDGSLRFCVDFRQLNAATVKDAHPIPRIDDLLDALHGARWFSTLDLKSGYWQVPIQEQDKEKTAFRTSSGQLFEFNQVPFGLCNCSRYVLPPHGPRLGWPPLGNLPLLLG